MRALVTGGASGLGLALAKALSHREISSSSVTSRRAALRRAGRRGIPHLGRALRA